MRLLSQSVDLLNRLFFLCGQAAVDRLWTWREQGVGATECSSSLSELGRGMFPAIGPRQEKIKLSLGLQTNIFCTVLYSIGYVDFFLSDYRPWEICFHNHMSQSLTRNQSITYCFCLSGAPDWYKQQRGTVHLQFQQPLKGVQKKICKGKVQFVFPTRLASKHQRLLTLICPDCIYKDL